MPTDPTDQLSGEPAALLAILAEDTAQAETVLGQMLPGELLTLASAAEELSDLALVVRKNKLRAEAEAAGTPCDRGYPLGGMNPRIDWCSVTPLYHQGLHVGSEPDRRTFSDSGSVRRITGDEKCGSPRHCRCKHGCDIP